MNLLDSLGSRGWTPLGTALLHTLWQGGLIAALLYLHLKTVPANRPQVRYAGAVGALVAILFGAFLTWAFLDHDSLPTQVSSPAMPSERFESSTPPLAEPTLSQAGTNAQKGSNELQSERSSQGILMLLWMVGVDIMLIRLSLALADLQDLRQNSKAPSELSLTQRFNALLRRTRPHWRQPKILVSSTLPGPVAFGFLRPTIVLPASLVTKTPPVLLEAILAHELAHIRRHDYLINLGQLLIETLLFFNPAVWWISRQIRIEREACCDAEAVRLIGSETDYASALADYASGVGAPLSAALNFGQERGPGTLLERVRRLLVPNYRPTLKLPIGAVTVFLGVSSLILLGLHQGSRMAIAVGAEWLSPEERIAKIKAIQETHPTMDPDLQYDEDLARQPGSKVRIAGIIKTEDGSPVNTEGLMLQADSERPGYGASHTLSHNKGRFFNAEIQPGQIHVSAYSPHYAATLLGPFKGEIAGSITNIAVVLKKGFTGRLLIQDEEGTPIPEATIYGQYDFPSHASISKVLSNTNGMTELSNVIAHPMRLRVRAPGFQEDHQNFTLNEGTTEPWTLHRAIPTTVLLRDEHGAPIEGATARLMRTEGFHNMSYGRGTQKVYAESNAEGALTFTELRIDTSYWFKIDAKGYGKTVLKNITAGVEDMSLTLGPPRNVSGVITGNLALLDIRTRWINGKRERLPSIRYRNPYKIKGYSDTYNETVFVQLEENRATFEITDLWPGELILTAGKQTITQTLETGLNEISIELSDQPIAVPAENTPIASLPERVVHLRFNTPEDHPKANGPAHVVVSAKKAAGGFDYQEMSLQVDNGLATLQVPVGSRVRVEPDNFTGYWFPSTNESSIPGGEPPFEIDLKCYPAGAIYGTIHEADGTPAKGIMISVVEVKRAEGRTNATLDVDVKNSSSSSDITEHFTATPLPIGGTYMIVIHRNTTYAVSPHFTITRENPVHETELVLQPGITIQGKILQPNGQPAAGVNFSHSFRAHPNHGFSISDQTTDRLGRFTLRNVDPDIPGAYAIRVHKNPSYQRFDESYDPHDEDLTIHLKTGHRVVGQVVDATTGWPIPGVEVYALPHPFSSERTGYLDADGKTDEAGNYVFTTLDSGDYRVNIRQGNVEFNREIIVNGQNSKPTTIRVNLSEWSKLKPTPPAESAQQL